MRTRMWIAGLMLIFAVATAAAQEGGDEEYVGRTPPRLGYVNGQVSFLRPGAEDWVQAQVNTALSPGDELYTGSPGTLELQIGPRAFVRGWGNTQIGLVNQEPDFIQFKVTTGSASFDIRSIEAGHTRRGGHAQRRLHDRSRRILSCGCCGRAHGLHNAPRRSGGRDPRGWAGPGHRPQRGGRSHRRR